MNASTELATWLVDALIERGMTDVVLCPGSRNAPLSFALAGRAIPRGAGQASGASAGGRDVGSRESDNVAGSGSSSSGLTLHSRSDERTAGFLALGIAKTSHRPVAVVTTSGTAAANLHPAMLEAAHAGVPLIAVTADRPASLRGTGANQTTDQPGLYGGAAAFADLARPDPAVLDSALGSPGPVHLNVQFTEPLVPDADGADGTAAGAVPPTTTDNSRYRDTQLGVPGRATRRGFGVGLGKRTVVVAGDDSGNRARLLAEAAGWPLFAEPSSGSRNGETPIRTYRLLLGATDGPGAELAGRIERAIVLGHPTLSRPVSRLLSREDVEVVSVRAEGRWPTRPFPVAEEYDAVEVAGKDNPAWLEEWRAADAALGEKLDGFVAAQPDLTPYDVAAAVNAAVPPNGLVFVGASNPVRDLDLMALPYPVGERRLVIANRGLAGIDGTISTAIGAVLGRPHTNRAILYVGDVTFLHDLTALVIGPAQARPDLTVVVANDNGGSIFATLEQGAPEHADSYDLLFGTPHGADLAQLCAGLGVPHWRVTDRAELDHALASPSGGLEVVEAVIRRDNRRALDEAIRALA